MGYIGAQFNEYCQEKGEGMSPVYPYSCFICGEFDQIQKITEKVYETCPNCGSKEIQRVISGTHSFSIQGGGVYNPGLKGPKTEPKIKLNRRRIKYEG